MMYFLHDQPHYILWPVIAFGKNETEGYWIGIGWLNLEIGICSKERRCLKQLHGV
jgi:hypothetical protein